MNNFPLSIHKSSGQWFKKVKGRQYYFGSIRTDPDGVAALKDWIARKDGILAGLDNLRVESTGSGKTLLEVAKLFADVLHHRLTHNQIADETFCDYQREIDEFVNVVGPNAIAKAIGPAHFTAYFNHLIAGRKLGPHRLGTAIRYIRALFNWAVKNGHLPPVVYGTEFVPPNTSPEALAVQKARSGDDAQDDPIFERDVIEWLLNRATPPFRAMILLTLNCGIGPSDIARLKWKHIKGRRLSLRRGKTGIKREAFLWRKTLDALERVKTLKHSRLAIEKEGVDALVFLTRKNHPYVRRERLMQGEKVVKIKIQNSISITFSRWMKEAREAGVIAAVIKLTYYNLRHTFRTHADNCPDTNAVKRSMGRPIDGSDRRYIRRPMKLRRLKRVAVIVKHCIWPTQKPKLDQQPPAVADALRVPPLRPGQMRLVS